MPQEEEEEELSVGSWSWQGGGRGGGGGCPVRYRGEEFANWRLVTQKVEKPPPRNWGDSKDSDIKAFILVFAKFSLLNPGPECRKRGQARKFCGSSIAMLWWRWNRCRVLPPFHARIGGFYQGRVIGIEGKEAV